MLCPSPCASPTTLGECIGVQLPVKSPNDPISTVLANFGDADICIGTRQVCTTVVKDIPHFLFINGIHEMCGTKITLDV